MLLALRRSVPRRHRTIRNRKAARMAGSIARLKIGRRCGRIRNRRAIRNIGRHRSRRAGTRGMLLSLVIREAMRGLLMVELEMLERGRRITTSGRTMGAGSRTTARNLMARNFGGSQRPAYTGQSTAPRGHLQDWLTQHQNVPVQDQERMLRNDPSFKRLPQGDQQRLAQQLRQVDKMPAPQRDLRLQRNEMLERLSPEERMSINRSGRQWAALPADRQTQVRRAFHDLRGVPLDQRQTVLNSARYQGQFTPEERGYSVGLFARGALRAAAIAKH